MPATTIRTPPALENFTKLEEHQESTPQSFFDGKPVLYYQGTAAKAWLPKSQRGSLPFFPQDFEGGATVPEGISDESAIEDTVEQQVELFVNTESLTIFCQATESGVSIPYPAVTLHAIKSIGSGEQKHPAVYLQLDLTAGGEDDDDFDTVELTLIPAPVAASSEADAAAPAKTETTKLFEAISECSNLNPDPTDEDDEEDDDRIVFEGDHQAMEGFTGVYVGSASGNLPPPMPGSSGWITADNVHEYFDADGNWIGEEGVSGELGEGAGTVHGRDDDDEQANGDEVNGDSESKRPRTGS